MKNDTLYIMIYITVGGMYFVFLPEASFGLWVLSLPACVCVYVWMPVYVSVCQPRVCPHHNSPPVQARITKFGPEVQNTLVKILLFWEVIDHDLQGRI